MLPHARKLVPYVIVFAVAIYLYSVTTQIQYNAPEERIGPDFWPKVILLLAMAACVYEVAKNLFFTKGEHELPGVLERIVETAPHNEEAGAQSEPGKFPHLLLGGVLITLAYLLVIEMLGFFLSTFLYLAAFMWLGRYRRWRVVLTTSLVGSLVFVFVFMRIVYVSLPLGHEP